MVRLAQLFATAKFDKVYNSVGFAKDAMNDVLDKVEKQIADFYDIVEKRMVYLV